MYNNIMKLNPKHHNPELLEQIDEFYWYDHNQYDSCGYDSMWGDDAGYYEEDWIHYHWLTTLDRVVVGDVITDMDGCRVYQEGDEILDYEVYSHSSINKTVGFFGAVMKAYKETNKPSDKLNRMCDIMTDRYPELYIRLLDIL